jgi:Zn-dependent metalloprotease
MNEAFSDIWELVSNITAPGKSTWLMEDIEKEPGLALRSMSDPKSEQPDTYGGTNWKTIDVLPHKQMTTAGDTQTAVS